MKAAGNRSSSSLLAGPHPARPPRQFCSAARAPRASLQPSRRCLAKVAHRSLGEGGRRGWRCRRLAWPQALVSSDQSGHAIVLTPHARKWFVRGSKCCASSRGTGALTRDRRRPLRQRAERLGTDARGGRPGLVLFVASRLSDLMIPSRNSCRRFRGLRGLAMVEAAAATRQETRRVNSSGPAVTLWRYRSNRDRIPGRSNRPHRPKHSRYRLCRRAPA